MSSTISTLEEVANQFQVWRDNKKSLSYSLCKLQKGIVENTIKKQLKHSGKNG